MLSFMQIRSPILLQLHNLSKIVLSMQYFDFYCTTNSIINSPLTGRKRCIYRYAHKDHSGISLKTSTSGNNNSKINDNEVNSMSKLGKMFLTQKYFEQYIDEYYEVDDSETLEDKERKKEQVSIAAKFSISDQRGVDGIFEVNELIQILRVERASNIVCIELPRSLFSHRFVVICSPYNYRHSQALIQAVRNCSKIKRNKTDPLPTRLFKNTAGWYCYYMNNIVLHVMVPEAREKYRLEFLWGVDEKDEMSNDEIL